MFVKYRMRVLSSLLLCSTVMHAGSMGTATHSNFTGALLGVGAGYVNTNLSKWTDVTMFSTFPSVTEYFREDNIKGTISPVVNASYFQDLNGHEHWLWGIKGIYKYLGIQHPSLLWSGTYQNGTFQSATFHTKVVQEFFLTLDAGYQILPNWLVYLGFGPSITGMQTELRGNMLPSTATTFEYSEKTQSKVFWGVAGQVGLEYLLPNRFAVDFSYNLIASPKSTMPNTYFYTDTSAFYSRFTQHAQLLEQGLNITINKYFS